MKEKEEDNINLIANFKIYIKFMKKYKAYFFAIIFIVILAQIASIFDKYLFKIVLDRGAEFIDGSLLRNEFVSILIVIAVIFFSLLITRSVLNWIQMSFVNKMEVNLIYDVKKKFFDHIINLDHYFHTTHKTGSMISKMNRGTRAIESITDFLIFDTIPLIIQLVVTGLFFSVFDKLSVVVIIATSICFISLGIYLSTIQKQPQKETNDAEDIEKGNLSDVLTNIDSVKYYGKENTIKNRYSSLALDTKVKLLKFWNFFRWYNSGENLILGIGTFFVIYFPLMRFLDGEMTIGTLAFLYSAFMSIIGPLYGFIHGVRKLYTALGDFDALFKYDKIKNEIIDVANAPNLKIARGEIEFSNISFKYKDKKISTINNLNLKVKTDEKIALVGHSGCGKTTLVKLLFRFYDVNSGKILIDGKNIKDFKQESLRGELSIVPQECILFDDTIYNNIAFSRQKASREEVLNAIKFAQLDKFIKSLPKKEKTVVGERGVKLSGGEKQRVSIARAILANKKVLVLDEATSSLDSETEFEIQRDLEKLMQGRTAIIIAHRLSTIMKADRIIVMEKGKIVQIGKHNELINCEGQYKRLWNLQKGGYLKD